MTELYEKNADFKAYVDRYSKCYHISVAEALTHRLVALYGQYITDLER